MPFSDKTLVLAVGAPKAATFSLYEHFRHHPDICVSKWKEPNFFVEADFNAEGMRRVTTKPEYLAQFTPTVRQNVFFEASPSYLRCSKSPQLIADFARTESLREVKIIVFLRDPIKRAFSNWLMDKRQGHQPLPFIEAFEQDRRRDHATEPMLIEHEYYRSSLYAADIGAFRDTFGAQNVVVKVIDQPQTTLDHHICSIEAELGLSYHQPGERASNVASLPKNRVVRYLYDNRALRRLQRKVLSDSSKEFLRKLTFKPDKTQINDLLTPTEISAIAACFSADRELLTAQEGLNLEHWLC